MTKNSDTAIMITLVKVNSVQPKTSLLLTNTQLLQNTKERERKKQKQKKTLTVENKPNTKVNWKK